VRARDAALAVLTALIWGLGFVAITFGLESFSAPQLTAARFLAACLFVPFVPRPKLRWSSLVLIGLTLFTGQFLLLFFAYTRGLPPGIAAVTQQTQVFFTVLLAAAFLRELPTGRQCAGMAVAFAGLCVIAATAGADLTLTGIALGLAGAVSWAVGNVLVKQTAGVSPVSLAVWASLVPPLPALVVSALTDHRRPLWTVPLHLSWISVGAALYLGAAATVVGYAVWGMLLQRYPTGLATPFALLVPCIGAAASALILGESFSAPRYMGMALVLAGLAVIVVPRPAARRIVAAAAR
jgi:O-acetylserine/cysteine efflux transporter